MIRSSSRSRQTYPSKVDAWLAGLMILAALAAITGVVIAGLEEGVMRFAQGAFVLLGVIGFLVWIFLRTNYTLDDRDLIVRSGPLTWRIPVSEITSVEKAAGFLRARSSPALSMDRLVVRYGKGRKLMISPADQEKFLADLRSRQ